MPLDRRQFMQIAVGAAAAPYLRAQVPALAPTGKLLRTPQYHQVTLLGGIALAQQQNAQAILNTFDEDALLKPFRTMGGLPAPGRDLGGWYTYLPDYNWHTGDAGLAPGHCFGQWTSAMARFAAAQNDAVLRTRVLRLQQRLGEAITPAFFEATRYPAYTLDKLNCGLLDAHTLLQQPEALALAGRVRTCALPNLPGSALERDTPWRKERDFSYTWDESYTLPENLYLLYAAGAGEPFRAMAQRFLFDTFFDPLARNENVLGGLHGYSHVNALGSAMQAWYVDGSRKHLDAAINGYRMLEAQTFATGGFAPDEIFVKPGSDRLLACLSASHNTFEAPCCTYAFLKLSRYLLEITRNGAYGDAMERLLWNSMFGALPLQPDGRTFYYADLNQSALRVYSAHRWPCCAGTYTQVAADYGIHTWMLGPEDEPSVWANLYLPSAFRWQQGATALQWTQTGEYPAKERVHLQLDADRPTRFALHLRVPGWCARPALAVNGQPWPMRVQLGFARIERLWKAGDRVDLHLPASLRLVPLPASDGALGERLAALAWGPWVLLPLAPAPQAKREELLRAERCGLEEWRVRTGNQDLYFRPFTAVGANTYATYVQMV